MKKRGFTLIELLAVIVILAIIALIATPIVMNVIEKSEKGAAERSAESYMDAVEVAIGTERLDGKRLEGTYTIQNDGSLCKGENNIGCSDSIEIDMNGQKPSSGTINIKEGVVTIKTTMKIGEYYVIYDANGKISARTYICEKIGEASKTVGAQYKCYIATPEADSTFYVLGETASDSTKIDLIMDRNFTDDAFSNTLAWCTDGVNDNRTCKNINSTEEGTPLKHIQDTFGNNVEVSFPTKDQIASANNGSTSNLPQWLYDYLDGQNVYGYWTASPNTDNAYHAWFVDSHGDVYSRTVDHSVGRGVRPVITISKNQLG